jgi:putative peptidoglycan lipid II flippase
MTQAKLIKPVLFITAFYIFSLFLSIFVQVILASRFGVGLEIDSYFVAFAIPSFFVLILSTSISKVFIPLFVDCQIKKGERSAWLLASNFINTALLFLILLIVLSELLAKYYIHWLAPGLNKPSYNLAVSLIRLFLPVIFFAGLNTFLTSLYYAANRFLKPSIAFVLNSMTVFLTVLFFSNRFGIYSIAYGVLAAAILQCFFLVPVLFHKYSFILEINNSDLIKLLRLLFPVVIGAMFYKAVPLIEKNIASGLSSGSISYLGYVYRIIPILLALTTTGISTTFFPLLSRYVSRKDWAKARRTFLLGINSLMIIVSPLVIYLIVLRVDVIKLLYQRGQFTYQDTLATASIFIYYLIALFFMAISTLPSQIYAITQDTKILIPIGLLETVAYAIYCVTLAKLFKLQGIAMAFALYYLIAFLINYAVLYIRIKNFSLRKIFITPAKILSTAIGSGLVLYYLNLYLKPIVNCNAASLLFIAVISLFSLFVYLILLHYVKVEEISEVKRIIFAKLKSRKPGLSILTEP